MELFWQAIACTLITVILCALLSSHGRDMTVALSLAVCGMILITAVVFLKPVIALIENLKETAQLEDDLLQVILKAVGVGMIGEMASLICADSGNAALGRALEMLTTAVVLWLGVPLITSLMCLVGEISGGA